MPDTFRTESRDQQEIDRYWNDLVSGHDVGNEPVETQLTTAIRAFQTIAGKPPPRPSQARVDREVMAAIERAAGRRGRDADMVQPAPVDIPLPLASPNGSHPGRAPAVRGEAARRAWQRAPMTFATAALALMALTAALIAGSHANWPRERLVSLPALSATTAVESEIVTETLFAEPIAALPGGHASIYLSQLHFGPGVSGQVYQQVGTMVYRVEQGSVALTLPDGERTVAAGEILSLPMEGGYFMQNSGQDEATAIQLWLLNATDTGMGVETTWFSDQTRGRSDILIYAGATMPEGPGEVTLERLTIPAGAALPPFTATGLDWTGIGSGRMTMALEGEKLPFRWDSGEKRTFGVAQSLPLPAPGTRVTLRNASDAPLVLYRLTVTPMGDG